MLTLSKQAKSLKTLPGFFSDEDMLDLLYGLGLGASGGGGGYNIGLALVNAIIRDIPVESRILVNVADLDDEDFCVMVGGIGAPSAITPMSILDFASYAIFGIDTFNQQQTSKITALLPVEAGPVNALLAMYIGWHNGLKVVNCDGAGRAVPSLTNLAYNYNGISISPLYLAGIINGQLNAQELKPEPQDAAQAEAAIRDNLGQYGNAAALLCWPQSGAQLKASATLVEDPFNHLYHLGKGLRRLRKDPDLVKGFLIMQDHVIESIFECKLQFIQSGSGGGYDDGYLFFLGSKLFSGDPKGFFAIQYENENMLIRSGNGFETITAPTFISMIFETDDGYIPLNNGDDLINQNLINKPAFVLLIKPNCLLFGNQMLPSFVSVLANPPFDFTGEIHPRQCLPSI